ncbi:MAG: hypothetical protein ABI333_20805 [bacterium]
MKKIQPLESYEAHEAYPSAVDTRLSRRTFLRSALTTTAAAAGVVLAPRTGATGTRPKPKLHKIHIRFRSTYRFRHGNYELQQLVAQSRDERLVQFLGSGKEAAGIETALRGLLEQHSCVDLRHGKKLARLQRRIGKALAEHYRARTRRWAKAPTVVLFVGVAWRACRGKCAAPTPYCHPPRQRPRPRRRK